MTDQQPHDDLEQRVIRLLARIRAMQAQQEAQLAAAAAAKDRPAERMAVQHTARQLAGQL